ncbi:MAG: hypothetical protein R3F56_17800 [Planctomycetota bacterium]
MDRNESTSGPHASRVIVPAVLIALALLWTVYLLRFRDGVGSTRSALAPPASALAPATPPMAPERRPVADTPTASVPRVLVVDEMQRPVTDAKAVQWPAAARSVHEAAARVVSRTASDGLLELQAQPEAGTRLAVCAEGFASAWVADAEKVSADLARLTLRRGVQFVVLCTDLQGQPMAGVDVVLSRAAGQRADASAAAALLSSPDSGQAIHRSRSAADGRAEFEGLGGGLYGYWVDAPGYVPVRGYESGGTVKVPGTAHTIAFARAIGAVVQVEGEVVGSSVAPRRTLGQMTAARTRAMDRERARLEARFPGALVYIASEGDSDDAWDPLECRVVVAHRGLMSAKVPLRATTEIDAPTVLDHQALVEPMEFGWATCAVVDIDGHPYEPVHPWLGTASGLGNWRRPAGGAVRMGVSTLLPVGTYRLTSIDPVERSVLRSSPSFTVVAGEEVRHVVELKVPLRRCRVRGELPDRQPFDLFLLDAQCPQLPGVSLSRTLPGSRDGQLVALPCARIEIEALAFGYPKLHKAVFVEPGDGEMSVTLSFGGGS